MNTIAQRIENLSAEKLALLCQRLRKASHGDADPLEIRRRASSAACPLSFAQQRLWFLQKLEPENPTYNCPSALRLRGDLNRDAVALALQNIVRRHEILRTAFREVDGAPFQHVMERLDVPLPVVDLS